ncbi:MAG TPA: hypothetical protein ENJ01_00300 [Gammaproteobacteria bacterium]|nr:hypothetical protein [Gammaproteobacteria bacterium]
MLYEIGGSGLRVSARQEQRLRLLAARNGQTIAPIHTRADYLRACIKAMPPAQARQLLDWLERHAS